MKDLKQVTVIGMGLLGGSITLAVRRSFPQVKAVGYSHRATTRQKARQLAVVSEIADDLRKSVADADLVILATPIRTFEQIFNEISGDLKPGSIITDVGSTKVLPHRWAARLLSRRVHYVGSHPIAGSEQRGVDFARDDLFDSTLCVLTVTKKTPQRAVAFLAEFWATLGCVVKTMTPAQHDRILAKISHLPHVVAACLVNANNSQTLKFAGKGFMDTSRIASGPSNIWADILLTNPANISKDIDKIINELQNFKAAIQSGNDISVQKILEKARRKRAEMITYKMTKKEITP